MSKHIKKKRLLMKIQPPVYIHKKVKDQDLTVVTSKYFLPWSAITNVPLCGAVMAKIEKLTKSFPNAHLKFNSDQENLGFVFSVSGKTFRHIGDEHNQDIGDKVASAKAFARACTIAKAIIKAAKEGLEEELNRTIAVLDVWREKEKNVIKDM